MTDFEEVLAHYDIHGQVIGTQKGPLITQIQFQPEAGTKLKTLESVLPDIARESGYPALRLSNFCAHNCIGFEIPNDTLETVPLMPLLQSQDFLSFKAELPLLLGVDIAGLPVFADLAKMPHLLLAGATGSGKSVELNAFILSLMSRLLPDQLKFVLIDPKRIEFALYNHQKYLLMPVVTDNAEASSALQMLIGEMNKRYQLFENAKVRNISEYHQKGKKMPYLVAIVDEFSDLVLTQADVSVQIQLLAQKARAAGIHLILATQRPSVDVVTGSIKANFPARLAFKTASAVDSKTILDTTGAEDLIGRGDALYLAPTGTLTRLHGAYIENEEIDTFLKPYHGTVEPLEMKAPQVKKPTKSAPAKKFILLAWIIAFWKWLGKRNQKKIVNFILNLFMKKR